MRAGLRECDNSAKEVRPPCRETYVPAAESRRLAAALEELDGDVYFSEYEFFDHLDPTRSVGPFKFLGEAFKLNLHLYNILRAAD